jgi:methionyl-tRNA synthetase
MPRIDEVDEEGGRPYPVITGDYSGAAAWASAPIRPGTPLQAPTPLYAKIDPAVVVEELNRLGGYDTDAEDG